MKNNCIPTVESIIKNSSKKKTLKTKSCKELLTVNEICSIFLSRQFVKKQNNSLLCSK